MFSRPGGTSFTTDVTSVISQVLSVSNNSVAYLDSHQRVVGLADGVSYITAKVNDVTLGQVGFMVNSSQLTYVIALNVLPIQSVSLSLSSPVSSRLSSVSGTVKINTGAFMFEGDSQTLVTSAVFDDQSLMEVDLVDGVIYQTSDTNLVVRALSNQVQAARGANKNSSSFVFASFQPSGFCSSSSIATGNATFNVMLESVQSIEVHVNQSVLGLSSDVAVMAAGIASSSEVHVMLRYIGGRVVDVTGDSRVIFNTTRSNDLFLVTSTAGIVYISPKSGRTGSGDLIVMFSGQSVVAQVTVSVVSTSRLLLTASPFPAYVGSSSNDVNILSRITESKYESALLHASLGLTNLQVVPLPAQQVIFRAVDPSTSSPSGIGTIENGVLQASSAGNVEIIAEFNGIQSSPLLVLVTDAAVTVRQLVSLQSDAGSQLGGVSGTVVGFLDVGAIFSDSREIASTFSNSSAVYPGLISFSSSDSSNAISIDSTTGAITIFKNLNTELTIYAQSNGSEATTNASFTCNLEPALGDLDLGHAVGVPIGGVTVGDVLEVPVRVNTGSNMLGSFEFVISYDIAVLEVVDVVSSLPGLLDYTVLSSNLRIAGAVDMFEVSGTAVELVVIRFRAVQARLTGLSGFIESLNGADLDGTPIGSGLVRAIIAGAVDFEVLAGSNRRAVVVSQRKQYLRQPSDSRLPARRSASCNVTGDLNGDCIFNVVDVRYLLVYLAERADGFSGYYGQLIQRRMQQDENFLLKLDVDKNSVINAKDASLLNEINLGIFYFVQDLSVVPASISSQCYTTISVSMTGKPGFGPTPYVSRVFFDISSSDSGFTSKLNQSMIIEGNLTTLSKGALLFGGIVEANLTNITTGEYQVRVASAFSGTNIGISVIQVTQDALFTSARFFGGLESGVFAYQTQLATTITAFGVHVNISSSGFHGYNPLLQFNSSLTTQQCLESLQGSTVLGSGSIAGIIIGSLSFLVLLSLSLLLYVRRRGTSDDRNFYLADAHREGAALAYVPEIDIPQLPSYVSESVQVVRPPVPTKPVEKRLWQTAWMNEPTSADVSDSQDEDDILSRAGSRSMFAVESKLSWKAKTAVVDDTYADIEASVWNEEQARAEAQQRRKEQREAAWARKKLERMALALQSSDENAAGELLRSKSMEYLDVVDERTRQESLS